MTIEVAMRRALPTGSSPRHPGGGRLPVAGHLNRAHGLPRGVHGGEPTFLAPRPHGWGPAFFVGAPERLAAPEAPRKPEAMAMPLGEANARQRARTAATRGGEGARGSQGPG